MLRKIELENPGNENKQKRALFKWWLDQNTRATWSDLLMALTRVDSSLGDTVRDIYGFKGKVRFTCINAICPGLPRTFMGCPRIHMYLYTTSIHVCIYISSSA